MSWRQRWNWSATGSGRAWSEAWSNREGWSEHWWNSAAGSPWTARQADHVSDGVDPQPLDTLLSNEQLFQRLVLELDASQAVRLSMICKTAWGVVRPLRALFDFVSVHAARTDDTSLVAWSELLENWRALAIFGGRELSILARTRSFVSAEGIVHPLPAEHVSFFLSWMCLRNRTRLRNLSPSATTCDGLWIDESADLVSNRQYIISGADITTAKGSSIGLVDSLSCIIAQIRPEDEELSGEYCNGRITWSNGSVWVRVLERRDVCAALAMTVSYERYRLRASVLLALAGGGFAVLSLDGLRLTGVASQTLETVVELARGLGVDLSVREGRVLFEWEDRHVGNDDQYYNISGPSNAPASISGKASNLNKLKEALAKPVSRHVLKKLLHDEACFGEVLTRMQRKTSS